MNGKKPIVATAVRGLVLLLLSISAFADDYQWIRMPDPKGEQLIPVDPEICKLYEANLQYFARLNTPMSCSRPIAPQFAKQIKEIEWADIDINHYPDLFRDVVISNQYLADKNADLIRKEIELAAEDVRKGVRVFRRARLSLAGRIHPGVRSDPEPYWIVQYGLYDTSPKNPDEFYRCTPGRGGIRGRGLHLYIVSEMTLRMTSTLGTVRRPSSYGQHIREIDNRLFVENIDPEAWIELNEIDATQPLTDTVCVFQFKKSTSGSK